MDTDPWGSAADPWTATTETTDASKDPAPHDPLNVPKDFALGPSPSIVSADPWGPGTASLESPKSLEMDMVGSTSHSTANNDVMPSTPTMIDPMAADMGAAGWDTKAVPDAWARETTAEPLDEPQTTDQQLATSLERVELEREPTIVDQEPAISALHDLTSAPPSPVAPTNLANWGGSHNEDEALRNAFAPVSSNAAPAPLLSSHDSPVFSPANLPKSPSFGDDAFGGFSGAGLPGTESDPLPTWETPYKGTDDDGGWGTPTFDSPVMGTTRPTSDDDREDETDAWGGGGAGPSSTTVAVERTRQKELEDDWEMARKAVERKEAVAPSEMVAGLQKRWKQLALECYGGSHVDEQQSAMRQPGTIEPIELIRSTIEGRDQ